MTTHHLDDTQPHAFWDNTHPPRLHVQSGDTVVFETLEASAGQVRPDSPAEVLAALSAPRATSLPREETKPRLGWRGCARDLHPITSTLPFPGSCE